MQKVIIHRQAVPERMQKVRTRILPEKVPMQRVALRLLQAIKAMRKAIMQRQWMSQHMLKEATRLHMVRILTLKVFTQRRTRTTLIQKANFPKQKGM